MFDHSKWEPASGQLIDVRYGGKHGDRSGNMAKTANSVHYLMEVQPDSVPRRFAASAHRRR